MVVWQVFAPSSFSLPLYALRIYASGFLCTICDVLYRSQAFYSFLAEFRNFLHLFQQEKNNEDYGQIAKSLALQGESPKG
jgi:hypothetical protein